MSCFHLQGVGRRESIQLPSFIGRNLQISPWFTGEIDISTFIKVGAVLDWIRLTCCESKLCEDACPYMWRSFSMAFVYARVDAVQFTSYCRLHAVRSALGLERQGQVPHVQSGDTAWQTFLTQNSICAFPFMRVAASIQSDFIKACGSTGSV